MAADEDSVTRPHRNWSDLPRTLLLLGAVIVCLLLVDVGLRLMAIATAAWLAGYLLAKVQRRS